MSLKIVNLSKKYAWHRRPRVVEDDDPELLEEDDELEKEGRPEAPVPSDRWVLRDVNITINPGEKVGIIGDNGSGKSTLLNIIAGITLPSEGYVTGRGMRVLLNSLRSPFQGQGSGRKNLCILASLLGVDAERLNARMPEILAFSQMEALIDQRVKTYSSAQYGRLSFAAALMLDPSIIISDEMLGVGDALYQQRCQQLITEKVNKEGVIFVFASNKLRSVSQLCPRVVWLHEGKVAADGPAGEVIEAFLARQEENGEADNAPAISPPASNGNSLTTQVSSGPPIAVPPNSQPSEKWQDQSTSVLKRKLARMRAAQERSVKYGRLPVIAEIGGRKVSWDEAEQQFKVEEGNEIEGLGRIADLAFDLTYLDSDAHHSRLKVAIETFDSDIELLVTVDEFCMGTHVFTAEMPTSLWAQKGYYLIQVDIPNLMIWPRVSYEAPYQKIKLVVRVNLRRMSDQHWASTTGRVKLELSGGTWKPVIPFAPDSEGPILMPPLGWEVCALSGTEKAASEDKDPKPVFAQSAS